MGLIRLSKLFIAGRLPLPDECLPSLKTFMIDRASKFLYFLLLLYRQTPF